VKYKKTKPPQTLTKNLNKIGKFWHNGRLLTKQEHDKLSWNEIFEANNKIGRTK
jgi:hypothetical protein